MKVDIKSEIRVPGQFLGALSGSMLLKLRKRKQILKGQKLSLRVVPTKVSNKPVAVLGHTVISP